VSPAPCRKERTHDELQRSRSDSRASAERRRRQPAAGLAAREEDHAIRHQDRWSDSQLAIAIPLLFDVRRRGPWSAARADVPSGQLAKNGEIAFATTRRG